MSDKSSKSDAVSGGWLNSLCALVSHKPLVIFRLDEEEVQEIKYSRLGISYFTLARSRGLFSNVRVPTACLVFADEGFYGPSAYFALLNSRTPITTLETRARIEHAQNIHPATEQGLLDLIDDKAIATNLRDRLSGEESVIPLSPYLSTELVKKLAENDENRAAMRMAMASLDEPKRYSSNRSLQQDAISTALGAFGIRVQERAKLLEVKADRETALSHVRIHEDVVIQEHARRVPGFSLVGEEDLTGRAVFENGSERLEIVTANKLPLEQVLGVDLIYYNATRQNIVMVQYKMLERERTGPDTDWIYRPDGQLDEELLRMKQFSKAQPPGPHEYRMNPQVFYLKFVRRDAELGKSPITMPIDHFDVMRHDPGCAGPRGGFKVSYDALDGRYLRQSPFLDLIRSGYIGAYADTTAALKSLVDATLENHRAVIAAVQSHRQYDQPAN